MAIVRADGVRGLYRGFGTTIFGLIPARVVRICALRNAHCCIACTPRSASQAYQCCEVCSICFAAEHHHAKGMFR